MVPKLTGDQRTLRLLVGLLLVDLGMAGIIGRWAWLGLFPLLTGGMGWCPVYALLANLRKDAEADASAGRSP